MGWEKLRNITFQKQKAFMGLGFCWFVWQSSHVNLYPAFFAACSSGKTWKNLCKLTKQPPKTSNNYHITSKEFQEEIQLLWPNEAFDLTKSSQKLLDLVFIAVSRRWAGSPRAQSSRRLIPPWRSGNISPKLGVPGVAVARGGWGTTAWPRCSIMKYILYIIRLQPFVHKTIWLFCVWLLLFIGTLSTRTGTLGVVNIQDSTKITKDIKHLWISMFWWSQSEPQMEPLSLAGSTCSSGHRFGAVYMMRFQNWRS